MSYIRTYQCIGRHSLYDIAKQFRVAKDACGGIDVRQSDELIFLLLQRSLNLVRRD